MTERITKVKDFCKGFIPNNAFVSLVSIIIAFIVSLVSSYICFIIFKNESQTYSDIVAGDITLLGIFKSIDFYLYYTFVIVFAITFLILCRYFNKRIRMVSNEFIEIHPFHILIVILPSILMLSKRVNSVSMLNLFLILIMITILIELKRKWIKAENITKIAASIFYIYLSSTGWLAAANYYFPNFTDRFYNYFIPLSWIILFVYISIVYLIIKSNLSNEDVIINRILSITQLTIPFILYCLINTRFYYKGSNYLPLYYERFKMIIICTVLGLFILNLVALINTFTKNRKMHSAFLSTAVSFTAVSFWNTGYNLVVNTDQFHTGETAIVYQQIVDFAAKWGKEFVSVLQGLGFLVSGLNKIIFGGTFATFEQANNLLLVIVAVLTTILLYQITDHKWIVLLIAPIMPIFLMMNRTYLIVPVYLLLLNKRIIANPVKWSYVYIATCIVHVWYQPSYGGAIAASLMPVLIYIWYLEFKNKFTFDFKNMRSKVKFCLFVLSVVVLGLACISLLTNAIHFLKTNGYETAIGNGISISQAIHYEPVYLTGINYLDRIIELLIKCGSGLFAFIIMLYMLLRYVVKEKDNVKKIQGIILTVSTTISYFLMLPAFFTRNDPGLPRIGAIGFIYFGFLTCILLYLYRSSITIKSLALFVVGFALSIGLYMIYPPYFRIHEKAYTIITIPDNAIYTNPNENGLENLGYSFVCNEQYLNEAMAINELCNTLLEDNQTFYDFTDKSIYYLLSNRKVPGLYVSPMVCSNELLQTESIIQLEKNDVPIVFINQPLNYIGISQSLRSYRLYRYFLDQDYNFVRYKGCNFLIRSDIDLKLIKDQIESVNLSNQVGVYDDLIDESSYNSSILEKLTINDIIASRSIEIIDNHMKIIAGGDSHAIFHSDNQIDYNNIQLFEIKLRNQPTANMTGQIFLDTERVSQNENNSIQFKIESNRILIPVYKFEQLKLDTKLVNFRIDFDNVVEGTDVTVDSINIYTLNEDQIANVAKQFDEIEKDVTDNRLDDIFHQPNLMYLPSQWGKSFELMSNRFRERDSAAIEWEQITDISFNNYYKFNQGVHGNQGEFLRLRLDCKGRKDVNTTLIVKGVDKNGNDLKEEFQFVANNGDLLIPIASSPNCLQSKELIGFDLIFSDLGEEHKINIEEAVLYQLIN